jgi:hypothetical protein
MSWSHLGAQSLLHVALPLFGVHPGFATDEAILCTTSATCSSQAVGVFASSLQSAAHYDQNYWKEDPDDKSYRRICAHQWRHVAIVVVALVSSVVGGPGGRIGVLWCWGQCCESADGRRRRRRRRLARIRRKAIAVFHGNFQSAVRRAHVFCDK